MKKSIYYFRIKIQVKNIFKYLNTNIRILYKTEYILCNFMKVDKTDNNVIYILIGSYT